MKALLQSIQRIRTTPATRALRRVAARYARARDYIMGALLGLYVSAAHASILAPKVCNVFKTVAGNDLYSIGAGVGLAGLLWAHSLDEGDNKLKTSAIRIGIAGLGLVNLQTIIETATGTPWGC